ncbi:MAG TPA: rhodanese-like domain-containing protein [Solirubrobacteraceae bacterium]|nr:rhodanese-like domain-containing protein [Solirubrobacteraceae bacterium]
MPRPIEAVGTSTAAFVGSAPGGPADRAVLVASVAAYDAVFGAGGHLGAAVRGFFANGGQRLWVAPALELLDEHDDVAIVACPGVADPGRLAAAAAWCEGRGDCFLIADVAQAGPPQAPVRSASAAAYWPWLVVGGEMVPPSGAVAGVYARTDVWAAPAGVVRGVLAGATGIAAQLTRAEQEQLLAAGVNAIRRFEGRGPLVWGARTLAPDADADWKYVNVRRLAIFLEHSIERGTRWAVFEPNGEPLWTELRDSVGAFLHWLFLAGAFAGRTPQEAYVVRCEPEAGSVVVLLGFAPSRPSEFALLRIRVELRRRTIADLLEAARRRLDRVQPAEAAEAMAAGALIVDIRSEAQVAREGRIPGAIHHPRNVLEWRADPDSGHSDPALAGALERRLIVVCDEGYQSSLAAATLQDLGVSRATDVVGGFQAWRAAGLPVER